jgi:hypothetical protein
MAWVSGRYRCCPSCGADAVPVVAGSELFDVQDRIWTGEQRCTSCDARMLYSRHAETQEEKQMAVKGKRGRRVETTGDGEGPEPLAPMRVTSETVGEPIVEDFLPGPTAIEQAQTELGPPAPAAEVQAAVDGQQRQVLKRCYQDVSAARLEHERRVSAAKRSKADLEAATTSLLEAVRRFTTDQPTLPLFDQAQAEADLTAMTQAGDTALTELEDTLDGDEPAWREADTPATDAQVDG